MEIERPGQQFQDWLETFRFIQFALLNLPACKAMAKGDIPKVPVIVQTSHPWHVLLQCSLPTLDAFPQVTGLRTVKLLVFLV